MKPQAQDIEQAQAHQIRCCRRHGHCPCDRLAMRSSTRFRGNGASNSAAAANVANVIPFHRGQPSPATVVGQVPANFSPGDGHDRHRNCGR